MRHRDPDGHFTSQDAMLASWLPVMLRWLWRDPIENALLICADFCSYEIARKWKFAAENVEQDPSLTEHIESTNRDAVCWLQRRQILLNAVRELRGVA